LRCPAAGSPASWSFPEARPLRLSGRSVSSGLPGRAASPGHRHLGCCLLPAAAGHLRSQGTSRTSPGTTGWAARAVACDAVAHCGQRAGKSAVAERHSRTCPAFQARERLSRRVPSPVVAPGMRPHHFVGIEASWASTGNAALGSLSGGCAWSWWLLFSRPGCGRPWLRRLWPTAGRGPGGPRITACRARRGCSVVAWRHASCGRPGSGGA
jgi:hypothetical protein